jgi:hypothetical protein
MSSEERDYLFAGRDDTMALEANFMNEVLSIDEMKARFPNEWILIGDPQTNPGPVLVGGTVPR